MIRILFGCPLFYPETGGMETISWHLLQGLRPFGYEFAVFTAQGKTDLPAISQYDGVTVYRFPMIESLAERNPRQILTIQRQIAQLKSHFQPHLVHLHLGGPLPISFFHLQTSNAYPVPTLVTIHDSLQGLNGANDTVLAQTLLLAKWVVADSQAMYADLYQLFPQLTNRFLLLPCALPSPPLLPVQLPFAPPRLLCLGRMEQDKGFDLAITALALLIEEYPELCLAMIGDGRMKGEWQKLAGELGLGERVSWLGKVPAQQLWQQINQSTLLLMPSRRREAFGLVALEAAQMARPVIATAAGGLAELILDGQTGLLIPPEDPVALAQAIRSLLSQPNIAQQMGNNAHQHAFDKFNWTSYLQAHHQLYSQQ